MKHLGKLAALGAVLAASASYAFATPISAGMTDVHIDQISATSYTSGTLVATSAGSLVAPDYTASYSESVYRGGTGATCPACLDFAFTVTDLSGDALNSATIFSFAGFTSNIFFVSGNGNHPITSANDVSGPSIQFELLGLGTGQSDTFVDFTNALAYKGGNFSTQNGFAENSPDLAPAPAPEPNSLILLGSGLVGAAGMFLRRRQTA